MQTFDPKSRFIANKVISEKHRERMADPDFHIAVEAALQTFADMEARSSGVDPQSSAAAFHRIAGSRAFALVLLNLSEITVLPKQPEKQTINYRA